MTPFFIIALPRSRTAWLSAWLSTDDTACLHEPLAECEALGDLMPLFKATNAATFGMADTGAVLFFDAIADRWPGAKYLFVHRDTRDVWASLHRAGLDGNVVWPLASAMIHAANRPGLLALHVAFDDLSNPKTLQRIWEHLVGLGFDAARAKRFIPQNIQADVDAMKARADVGRFLRLMHSTGGCNA